MASTNDWQFNSAHGYIQHVIEIQTDKAHFNGDKPNARPDLEQMPYMLNFIKKNDVLLTNHPT